MDVRGRWWNGVWGRMGRRDIWLMSDGARWLVRGRLGGDEGQEVRHHFTKEEPARAMVRRMMAVTAGDWRSLIDPLRRESQRREGGD